MIIKRTMLTASYKSLQVLSAFKFMKYFYHKQIRKSEIIFLFFLAEHVVDNLPNSFHSYVGKNVHTHLLICVDDSMPFESDFMMQSNFYLLLLNLNMHYKQLVTIVIEIMVFHNNS